MTENSAIFNARHGGGSFHPHRQPAPTAQDCLKRGTGANGERPGSYLVNVGQVLIAGSGEYVPSTGVRACPFRRMVRCHGRLV